MRKLTAIFVLKVYTIIWTGIMSVFMFINWLAVQDLTIYCRENPGCTLEPSNIWQPMLASTLMAILGTAGYIVEE